MKQTTEKVDPLTRIQEEIKEVVRREEEYRQLTSTTIIPTINENERIERAEHNFEIETDDIDITNLHDNTNNNNIQDSGPLLSLTPSVISKESLDEMHSDDSGISSSSILVINGQTHTQSIKETDSNNMKSISPIINNKEQRYIGPNCYNLIPDPPQQKTCNVTTPPINKTRQITFNAAHKGVMQRFIASRGKLQLNRNVSNNEIMLNGKSAAALLGVSPSTIITPPNTPTPQAINNILMPETIAHNPTSIIIPAVIERDSEGRPIRPGYVPVELKIQRELKDLKSRESELKKIRKIRQSTPDLLNAIDNGNVETDDEDSDVEHCYGPGQLRSAKSISELCDSTHGSISPSVTPSPDFEKFNHNRNDNRSFGMRPAVSLAQLCDLTPEEAPSSHRLIAQWESLIQQNA